MRRSGRSMKEVAWVAGSSLSAVENAGPWQTQKSCVVVGNKSLPGGGQEHQLGSQEV